MPKGLKGFQKGNKEGRHWKGKNNPLQRKRMMGKQNPAWRGGHVSRWKKLYIKIKKSYCEHCKFIAIHSIQLDVDHIDGNNKNNDINNLQTLCANCHRLKTWKNKDNIVKYKKHRNQWN